jgi:hypothetical protein
MAPLEFLAAVNPRFDETRWVAREYGPFTAGGWLLVCALVVAFLTFKYTINRVLAKRQATELAALMRDSAAFSARWRVDLTAEINRTQRVISLLRRNQKGSPAWVS